MPLHRRQQLTLIINPQWHPDTKSLRDRIFANGGSIRNGDVDAVDKFFTRPLYHYGLKDAIVEFGPYAGDNLNAMLVKLVYPSSSTATLSNNNFVASDYTRETGLTGDGSTKYLQTNTNVQTVMSSNNCGLAVYIRASGNNSCQIGAGGFILNQNNSGNTNAGVGSNAIPDTSTQGWYSANSNSGAATSTILYRNAVQVGTGFTSATLPSVTCTVHARNNFGSIIQYTNRPLGCYMLHTFLSATQEQQVYTMVQNLMTAFGRAV